MRRIKRLVIVFAVLVAVTGVTGRAFAGTPSQQTPATAKQARLTQLQRAILGMLQQRLKPAEMGRQLTQQYGLEVPGRRADDSGIHPTTVRGSVDVTSPWFVHDPDTDEWWVVATWDWNVNPEVISHDCGWICWDNESIGGDDAFGISFSRSVHSWNGYNLQTWGETDYYPSRNNRAYPKTVNANGVVFAGQDKIHFDTPLCDENNPAPPGQSCVDGILFPGFDDYSFYHGALLYDVGDTGAIGCGRIQATEKYVHTGDGSQITGISLGGGGGAASIGIQWSGGNKGWEQASYATPYDYVTPC